MGRKILIGVGLAFLAVFTWLAVRPSPQGQLDELIAELRARGEPVTLAELQPPIPPPEQNGAADLDAAIALLAEIDPRAVSSELSFTPAGIEMFYTPDWEFAALAVLDPDYASSDTSQDSLEFLRTFAAQLDEVYVCVAAARRKPSIMWVVTPRNSGPAIAATIYRRSTMSIVHALLRARVITGATPAQRLDAIRVSFDLTSRWRPRGPEHFAAAHAYSEACVLLRTSLERGWIEPAAAHRELQPQLDPSWRGRSAQIVRGKRADLIEQMPHWLDGSAEEALWGETPHPSRKFADDFQFEDDYRSGPMLDIPSYLFRARWQVVGWLRDLDPLLESDRDPQALSLAHERRSRSLVPTERMLAAIHAGLFAADAVGRLASTALAAYAYREQHGSWPESLTDTALSRPPGTEIDPFTGTEFQMERDGDDLVLRAQPWPGIADEEEQAIEAGYVWRLTPR